MRSLLVAVINFYQKWISPSLAPRCKYYPSCSTYAASAISHYGIRGIGMALWRLVRCNPWSHGGVDYAVKDSSINNFQKTNRTTEKTSVGAN